MHNIFFILESLFVSLNQFFYSGLNLVLLLLFFYYILQLFYFHTLSFKSFRLIFYVLKMYCFDYFLNFLLEILVFC